MTRRYFGNLLLDPAPGDTGGGGGGTPGMISVEASNAAIEKARTEEKNKLYPQIDTLKTENAAHAVKVQALEAEKVKLAQQAAEATSKLQAIETARTADGNTINVQKLVEEITSRTLQEANAVHQKQIEALTTEVSGIRTQNKSLTLAQYRDKKIGEIGRENIIVELVGGDSEQAIDESIARAKATFDHTKSRITGGATPSHNTPPPAAPPVLPGTMPTPPASGAPGAPGVPEVRSMPMTDWKTQRQSIKATAAKRYAGAPS